MKKVLFVDDEINILNSMRRILRLEKVDFNFEFIEGSPKALEYLKANPIDIIVTDFNMPVLNGCELAAHAKVNWPDVKVLLLSGNDCDDFLGDENVDRVLSKPCEIALLIKELKGLSSGRK